MTLEDLMDSSGSHLYSPLFVPMPQEDYPPPPDPCLAPYPLLKAWLTSCVPLSVFIRCVTPDIPNPDSYAARYPYISYAMDVHPDFGNLTPDARLRVKWTMTLVASKDHETRMDYYTRLYKDLRMPTPTTPTTPATPAQDLSLSELDPEKISVKELSRYITRFRRQQAQADLTSSQTLRNLLDRVVSNYLSHDDPSTLVRISDLRQIAAAYRDIQAIQRVGLGLPADHVGFDLEGQDSRGRKLPTINVTLAQLPAPAPSPASPASPASEDPAA